MKRLIAFRLDEFTYNELQKHLEESKQGVSDFIRIAIYEKLQRIELSKNKAIDKQKH